MADLFGMLQAAAGQVGGEYQISRSLRFNSADSAYLSRTPASASNRKTFTISFWVKRSTTGGSDLFRGTNANSNGFLSAFLPNGNLYLFDFGAAPGGFQIWSARVFRDFSSWYHIVIAVDTTQATDSNRIKVYVNGVEESIASWNVGGGASRYPSPNADFVWNTTATHELGYAASYGFLNAYITEFYNIDGQALTPSSFGETNATTGVWSPIAYAGSYGTNGFYLNFSDNSGVTSTTLGKDQAGSNNWTPSGSPGFSVTAGAGNDSLVDTPTQYGTDTGAGGEVRGNYATLNPLATPAGYVVTNGNLTLADQGAHIQTRATMAFPKSSGKTYLEATLAVATGGGIGVTSLMGPASGYPGAIANLWWVYDNQVNFAILNQTTQTNYSSRISTGQVWQIAHDAATGKVWIGFNNTWINSTNGTDGDPANGNNPTFTVTTGVDIFPFFETAGNTWDVNFGQRPFAYTAPSGFKALVTTNLPEPTVVQGDDYFNTVLYTGTLTTPHAISGVGFAPDFIWFKSRSQAYNNYLFNKITSGSNFLFSNAPNAEGTTGDSISFDSDGFTITAGSALNDSFGSPNNMVAWNWKANGAGSLNELGTISSTVSANTTAGISIVTYTGNGGNAPATIGHGLGVAPQMMILKFRDATSAWSVYHASLGNTKRLTLNTTDAENTSTGYWNNTSPTSTVFTVGMDFNQFTPFNYVVYCFAEVEGFSKFGSFVGNASTDGPFVYTGFRPAFVLIKCSTGSGLGWFIFDAERNAYNVVDDYLVANTSAAEAVGLDMDFTANGFKIRNNNGNINGNATTHIYMAFAENPFKNSLAR